MSDDPATPSTPDDNATPPTGGTPFRPPSVKELNELLPQYEFVELIGAGGMGAVYKARQPKLNRFVAIKILPPIPEDELGFAERFQREAQSMAQLSHPHIVSVYDFGETSDGKLYFVMEYVEGADLHRLITEGQLTLDHFYGWIPQVCSAIQYAHDHGVVHRDIKPANILIDREGRVRIADFGLAKLTGGDQPETQLTMANLSMGTPDYAAPEQIDASAGVDWRADIYSLGVVMYQMLTGRLPRGAFPLPSERDPDLDKRLDEVVLKAMQSEPALRFQRASEIGHRLTEIQSRPAPHVLIQPVGQLSHKAKPAAQPTRRPSLIPVVAGLVGASMLAGLVLLSVRNRHASKPARPEKDTVAATTGSSEAPAAKPGGKGPKPSHPNPDPNPDSPPRDFTRRPAAEGEDPRPNFSAFRDKLGPRKSTGERIEVGKIRQNQANLVAVSKEGGPIIQAPLAAMPEELIDVVELAIGQGPFRNGQSRPFAIALQKNGKLLGWGAGDAGQTDIPAEAIDVTRVAAGSTHALALRRDGTVLAWGGNESGQTDVPEGLAEVIAIGAGKDFSVALRSDGTVAAWGGGPAAKVPEGLDGVKAIAAGYTHVVALKGDGTVTTWGSDEFGQLKTPDDLKGVEAIAATFASSFALLEKGKVVGWGAGGSEAVPEESGIQEIFATGDTLVARDSKHRLLVHGPSGRPSAFPTLLQQLPREFRIVVSEKVVFAYRPATLRPAGGEEGAFTSAPVTAPAESAPPEAPGPVESDTPPSLPPLSEAGRQIEDLQAKFEQAYLDQVSRPHDEALGQLNAFYLNHLEERQAAAAAARLLDEALAWRSEAERVRAGEPLPESDDPALPPALIELRQTYRQSAAASEAVRKEAEAGLLDKYDEALEAMQDRFTQEQKLDEALEVKAFREGL